MLEFGGLWKHKNNQHELVPPKTECGCPSGGGIKNSHIHYGGTQKKKKKQEKKLLSSSSFSIHLLSVCLCFPDEDILFSKLLSVSCLFVRRLLVSVFLVLFHF